jgi:pimeloyl-ACP methyl ester carboxylesterase
MMTWARRFFLIVLLIYVVVAAAVFFAQRKFLYIPPDFYAPPPQGFTEVKSSSGSLGWHSPAKDDRPTVMIFHGNGSSIESNMHIFRDLQAAGFGVWSVGYPGYPGNVGTPSQESLMTAAIDQYETLKAKGAEDIIFYGTSLGSGVAAQLAARYEPTLLILDAPFNSMADMAQRTMPLLPARLLLKDKWDSRRALSGQDIPLIWIHGTADQIVPLSQGQKLFDGYDGPKSSHVIAGAHHTNTWLTGGREIVLNALESL